MPGCPPQGPPQSHFFRDLFAQTIAAVLQTTTGGLLGAITGRIMEWFTRKGANAANPNPYAAQTPQYPNPAYGATPAAYPNTAYPNSTCQNATFAAAPAPYTTPPAAGYPAQPAASYPGAAQTYPSTAYPTAAQSYPGTTPQTYPSTAQTYPSTAQTYPATAQTYPSAAQAYPGASPAAPTNVYAAAAQPAQQVAQSYAGPTQVYDARTGQLVTPDANPYATRDIAMAGALYAGIAYEVHTLGPDGNYSTPVNTATYDFHTGDRFMVYYRPSLPGHMEIYNVNAAGKQTLIDSSNMAAGQMVALGPYEFTNDLGEESLHLVLSPCTSPRLITATRDIVKVGASPQPTPGAADVQLGNCGAPTARGLDLKTRDIAKVGVEGTTSFALDPISPKELKSGQITPRQMTIVFHHR